MQSASIPLQLIKDQITGEHGINLYMLRTDLNHPLISGNKLFKLKYNLSEAKEKGKKTLLTFGGAFSNHIVATAAAGKESGFTTIGIIRGDEHEVLNPTLQLALDHGMELHYISREAYKNKNTPEFNDFLKRKFSDFFLIPEGGANESGIKGCKEILQHIDIDFNYICCACGTGTTFTGLISGLKNDQRALGFQVLKAENYIQGEVKYWLEKLGQEQKNNWEVNEDFHFNGYAKYNEELITFIRWFKKENNILLDPVYTGKMMFGLYELIKKGKFNKNETVIAIHTGGLQGNAGFEQMKDI